ARRAPGGRLPVRAAPAGVAACRRRRRHPPASRRQRRHRDGAPRCNRPARSPERSREGGDATGDSFVASWAPAILARETALREDEALLWPAPTYSSKSRMRRRSGKRNIQSAAMPMVPRPPRRTAGTAPTRAAIEPDTNAPSWFEVPVNSECTALTRPSIATGVLICTIEERITTLT